MFDDHFEKTFRRLSSPFFSMGEVFETPNETVQTFGPYYYGYVKTVGEDGIPHVTEWGNTKPTGSLSDSTVRDPYVDVSVNDKDHTLKIVSEMPGIEKSDIKLNVSDKLVLVSAQHGERKYEKKIPLPSKVDENSAKAKYTNGVLEITLSMAKEKPKGKLVTIE
ncbi:archaeal heat shock protein Hsp20 [Nitrosopumilus sp.]|uniref:archaeal heat shock protein Hsp20 n=1 Tax=Nitrosopumilus sp. TaxID=2024843 RepID=UPI003B5C3B6D